MALIKDGQIVNDPWRSAEDGVAGAQGGYLILTLDQWQADRSAWLEHNGPLGLRLGSDQPPSSVAGDLEHFDLIALEFPVFGDGRGYSYARQLRERYGYHGELRAVGDVLRDQLLFMHRCGFDSFEINSADPVGDWAHAIGEITVWYQPMLDGRRPFVSQVKQKPAGATR